MTKQQVKEKKEIRVSFRKLVPEIPSTTYATFGLYRYPAKFIPQVVAYKLRDYKNSQLKVFDPFGGCGTVGLVARMYNLNYELWDLNPILPILHKIAIMETPNNLDINNIINSVISTREKFLPKWGKINYWFPNEILPVLSKMWGYYHSLENNNIKKLLIIPSLKITRYFSYNDQQRQKLSKSPKSIKRIEKLLRSDWKNIFIKMLSTEINTVIRRIDEYKGMLTGRSKEIVVRGGIDTIEESFKKRNKENNWDILFTSPPYLQAQEYIRNSKLDLFWLKYSEEQIKRFSKKELPYRHVDPININSITYNKYHDIIKERHLKTMYERYFHGIIGALDRLSSYVNKYLYLFVGPATVRGIPIPIDLILIEHFIKKGWNHKETLVDEIPSRVMFKTKINPANRMKDNRIKAEKLVILKR